MKEIYNKHPNFKDVVYVDMDGTVADFKSKWELHYGLPLTEENYTIVGGNTPDGFFRDLDVIDGAKESINELDKHFDIHFLSTAEWNNPTSWMDKRLWIEEHFPKFVKKLTLTHNKHLLVGKYLIDDRVHNGADRFVGDHIQIHGEKFPNWNCVNEYIFVKENIWQVKV